LVEICEDEEIQQQLSAMMHNTASPCKMTKPQSNKLYKLLNLSKMDYFVPKITQMLSTCYELKGPSPLKGLLSVIKPQNECNSKFQLHSSVLTA